MMKQIYLTEDMKGTCPSDKKKSEIGDLSIGEVAYVVPWAIKINQDSRFVVIKCFGISDKPVGTAHLKIKKVKDGYLAYKPSLGNYKYIDYGMKYDASDYEYIAFTDEDFNCDSHSSEVK